MHETWRPGGLRGVSTAQRRLPRQACAGHAAGKVSAQATVGTCRDADRLDHPRVHVTPWPGMLSIDVARRGQRPPVGRPSWPELFARP